MVQNERDRSAIASSDSPPPKRLKTNVTSAPVKTSTNGFPENGVKVDSIPIETKAEPTGGPGISSTSARFQLRHDVAMPPCGGILPDALPHDLKMPPDPARTYAFDPDPFQLASIHAIHRGESVMVSAHTSAGKTAVAEYAIAQSLRNKQRVVYTSPIKALSNQKYRELLAEFGDVGLMTGDIAIATNASCLVMTTEVLRSMLYRGSEVMREVSWVVFDEIHYMRDPERGVVWEEAIILLPKSVRFVFLSATIPNAKEFAEWIAGLHQQPCHVVYTDYRPTPLNHYVYPNGDQGFYLVMDEHGNFRSDNFSQAMGALSKALAKPEGGHKSRIHGREQMRRELATGIERILRTIMMRKLDPVIVFVFSRKETEILAMQLSKLDFTDDGEKDMIEQVFNNAISALAEEDQKLPQIQHILPLLKLGIGIHHSGLLPLLKEIVEILFQESLIKILFATETFAMGVNMPAKTVVFSNVEKYDGKQNRDLNSGEYIQMSGRAGRRGIDEQGFVVSVFQTVRDESRAKKMMQGNPNALNSAFKLTPNMILNMLRVDGMRPEYMLERSFYQFQNNASVPRLEAALHQYNGKTLPEVPDEEDVTRYRACLDHLDNLGKELKEVIHNPDNVIGLLNPGRFVWVRTPDGTDYGWGVVLRWTSLADNAGNAPRLIQSFKDPVTVPLFAEDPEVAKLLGLARTVDVKEEDGGADGEKDHVVDVTTGTNVPASRGNPQETILLDVLVHSLQMFPKKGDMVPAGGKYHIHLNNYGPEFFAPPAPTFGPAGSTTTRRGKFDPIATRSILLSSVHRISAIKVKLPDDLRGAHGLNRVAKSLAEVCRRYNDKIPVIDFETSMKIKDEAYSRLKTQILALETQIKEIPLVKPMLEKKDDVKARKRLVEACEALELKQRLLEQRDVLTKRLSTSKSVMQIDELKARKRVLRRLGFTNSQDIVEHKGRTACLFSLGDSILMTEILYGGYIMTLEPAEIAAVVSLLAHTEKPSDQAPRLPPKVADGVALVRSVALNIGTVHRSCGLPVDPKEYSQSFSADLALVVYEWCSGKPFPEVMAKTEMFEGSVIRGMRSLDELLLQMVEATQAMGNEDLGQRCTAARGALRREKDIVFAASLYL